MKLCKYKGVTQRRYNKELPQEQKKKSILDLDANIRTKKKVLF